MCMIREPSFVRGHCIQPTPPIIELIDLTNIDDEIVEISEDEQLERSFFAFLEERNMINLETDLNTVVAHQESIVLEQNINAPIIPIILETSGTDQPTEGRDVEVDTPPPVEEIITVVIPH